MNTRIGSGRRTTPTSTGAINAHSHGHNEPVVIGTHLFIRHETDAETRLLPSANLWFTLAGLCWNEFLQTRSN